MPAIRERVSIESPGPEGYLGLNTALQFSQLTPSQSPSMKNAWMSKLGAIGKRPGTIPVTSSPLGVAAEHLTVYRSGATDKIIAASNNRLYKFASNAWVQLNGTLNRSDIYDVDFTDGNSNARKIIADKGSLKAYDDATETVSAITPAPDDPNTAPPNVLPTLNNKGIKYVWTYQSHVFVAFERSDEVYYSKRFTYDYFPSVQWERWVRNNDYVNGCGLAFGSVMLVPLRRGWGVLTGTVFDDFQGGYFLNTVNGVVAPRSIQKITYPNGVQTVVYLSDDGVHEIFDTGVTESGARQYATRSLMKDKIDFNALGLLDSEKEAAIGHFFPEWSIYLLCFKQGSTMLAYVYDTRNREWYPWTNMDINSIINSDGVLYYTGSDRHLRKFDKNLYSDWNDMNKTSGTPVHFQRYSPLLSVEFSGFPSTWDYYLVEAKQWLEPSSLDVSVNFTQTTSSISIESAWKNNVFMWGVSKWSEAQWANLNFTDIVNAPDQLIFHYPSKYCQVLWENNRDEPVEIYRDRWIVRPSIKG